MRSHKLALLLAQSNLPHADDHNSISMTKEYYVVRNKYILCIPLYRNSKRFIVMLCVYAGLEFTWSWFSESY